MSASRTPRSAIVPKDRKQQNARLKRVARLKWEAAQVLKSMQAGASLRLHYQRGRPLWDLTTGTFVTADVAELVIADNRVVGVGDALFPGVHSQTWRFSDDD
jgi:hypothetical protein